MTIKRRIDDALRENNIYLRKNSALNTCAHVDFVFATSYVLVGLLSSVPRLMTFGKRER